MAASPETIWNTDGIIFPRKAGNLSKIFASFKNDYNEQVHKCLDIDFFPVKYLEEVEITETKKSGCDSDIESPGARFMSCMLVIHVFMGRDNIFT